MIGRTNKQLKMRVLMVDDDLGSPNSMRGRVLTELVDEFHSRNTELVKATSYEDGLAAVISDAALHCICVDWTLGKNDATTHAQALELLRSIRQRNENVPVFLMADRDAKKASRWRPWSWRTSLSGCLRTRRRLSLGELLRRSSGTWNTCCRPSPMR